MNQRQPQIMAAQSSRATVSGTARDTSQSALQGARVQLDPGGLRAATDAQGQFRITDVPLGDYTLTVSYVGLQSFYAANQIDGRPGHVRRRHAAGGVEYRSSVGYCRASAGRTRGAINIERTADNLVQVLPAKVITSLPNTNIADAVGRLPRLWSAMKAKASMCRSAAPNRGPAALP
jgi:hypothetical protein